MTGWARPSSAAGQMAGRAEVMRPEALVHGSAWGTGTFHEEARLGMS